MSTENETATSGALDPALGAFKDWSNYLLVTTVAAVGWVGSDKATIQPAGLKVVAIWCLGLSAVFGILTLALVPLVAEKMPREPGKSIYAVQVEFYIVKQWHAYLTMACRPQHILFMLGIVLFCVGTVPKVATESSARIGVVVGLLAAVLGLVSRVDLRERVVKRSKPSERPGQDD